MENYNFITVLESGGAEVQPIGGSLTRYTVWAVGAGITFQMVTELGVLGGIAAAPFVALDYLVVLNAKRQAQNELLAYYANIKEPILEWQQSPRDAEVFNRAEQHRELLTLSENGLFKMNKIEVVEMYWKDVDYVETFEEFEARREDIRRDYLREWAKNVSNDAMWRKQYLHNQRIVLPKLNGSEVLAK